MPPDELDKEEFCRESFMMSNEQLGSKYGMSTSSISGWKKALRKVGYTLGTVKTYRGKTFAPRVVVNEVEPEFPEVEPAGFPESITEDYTSYEVLDRDRSIILGDCHIPDHDSRMLDMAYRVAERYNIKTLILNGDFVKLDTFSTWRRTHPNQEDFVKDDLLPATEILKLFMRQFDETFWHKGNHEERLTRWVHGQFDIRWFFESLLGVQYSAYPFTVQRSAGEEVLICHPKQHRVNPMALPLKLCGQYLKHVVCGHLHRLAFGWHESGQFWGAEGGHALSVSKTHYKATSVDTYPTWNCGFIMLLDAWPHLIEPRNYEFYMEPHSDIEQPRKQQPPDEVLKAQEILAQWEAQNVE